MTKRISPLLPGLSYVALGSYYLLVLTVLSNYERTTMSIALAQTYAYPMMIGGILLGSLTGNALGVASHRWSRNDNRKPRPELIMALLGGITLLLTLFTAPASVAAMQRFQESAFEIRLLPFNVAFVASAYLVAGIRCLLPK